MCGIAGIAGGGTDPAVLERMAAAMAHRGPDGQATWRDDDAGLAFRRLAIIDLDERSMQPLHLGRWHLVFNGEVYDYRERREDLRALGHRFATEGDGEVLLHAWDEWGPAALDRLDGMYAFAIWHDERRELHLASDLFGEKPVYWTLDDGRLVFASDIRALLHARPDLGAPRPEALAPYAGRGLMPPIDRSFFAGVNRLPGGHLLRFRDGVASVRRYWTPREVPVPRRYEDAVSELRGRLSESVRRRLRADVPVGTSLSGGVDSSAVATIAGQLAPASVRHAFTARFPGFERDEWRFAERVAHRAGVVEHHAIEPTAADLLEDLEALVAFQEEPFTSSSIYAQWRVMRCAHEHGVTVLLDGQGADELFGGYPGANGWALRSEGLGATMRGLASAGDRADVLNAIGSEHVPGWYARRHRRAEASPYGSAEVADAAAAVVPPAAGGSHPLARELRRQSLHTSMPQLLRYADRNSMANSREVRLPFLSRTVAEFALSAPPQFLYRNGVRKALLRDAVAELVPPDVLARRDKVGFETPQARWLAEPAWRTRAGEVLLDDRARARSLYASEVIEADLRAGRWRDDRALWRALNLELWLCAFERAPALSGLA